jgi:hypothetical protein
MRLKTSSRRFSLFLAGVSMGDPSDGESGPRQFTIHLLRLEAHRIKGGVLAGFPVPTEFMDPIGRIAISWSFFERDFNLLIEGMLKQCAREEPDWRWRSFEKRTRLFRELVPTAFSASEPIQAHLLGLASDAAGLAWRRNIILHGSSRTHIRWGGIFLDFTGRHNRRYHTLEFTLDSIIDFFYEIASLCGQTRVTLDPTDHHPAALSLPDRSLLRAFAANNLTTPPTSETPQSPPPPSES